MLSCSASSFFLRLSLDTLSCYSLHFCLSLPPFLLATYLFSSIARRRLQNDKQDDANHTGKQCREKRQTET